MENTKDRCQKPEVRMKPAEYSVSSKVKQALLIAALSICLFNTLYSAEITFKTQSLTVWGQDQIIEGRIDTITAPEAYLYLNHKAILFTISSDSTFSVPVKLTEGSNRIYVQLTLGSSKITSDTLTLTLGYRLRPEIYAFAAVSGRDVTLNSEIIENPDSSDLSYLWSEDPENPATGILAPASEATASLTIPASFPEGEYYFNLTVAASDGDTTKFRTYVTADSSAVIPFNIKTDHASWIDKAVIYEVTPHNFVYNGKFNNIIQKLPDLVQLGITALWIQPIYKTHGGGQGYDIIDYFSVRTDLGSEADLRKLIRTAKSMGLKVMFDFVANHTSINHPYAIHSKLYGVNSHYWTYYQREKSSPDVPYSQYENTVDGLFYNYFWGDLPNLNFDNPEVQKWITEAARYWIEKYDIDGYRFDAVWGVNARKPDYTKQLRLALKRIKPDILMLAEDKAPWPNVFDERFDLAFDWTETDDWVSQWVWQYSYNDPGTDASRTIFNSGGETDRAQRLRASLTNNGKGYPANAKILRFMGNNDVHHFIRHHGLERTKMAAALVFSLHGVPLLYNGQEIGKNLPHPYYTQEIFSANQTIQAQDKGMYQYYKRLIQLKKSIPALYGDNFEETPVSPSGRVFAFRRWHENQNVFTVTNMSSSSLNAVLSVPITRLNLDSTKTYYLTDMFNGTVQPGRLNDLASVQVTMNQYSTRLFLLADTVMSTVGVDSPLTSYIPEKFDLSQNYPNPFNPSTIIKYSLPHPGKVTLKVFDLLGREVATLFNGYGQAGNFSIIFDGQSLSSGIYLYNIRFEDQSITKKMILVK